ncbi:PEP/pyruvate-binding domain-containing protein [Oerskovia turbata]
MLIPLAEAIPETCGGKAGALGALLRAGLPVPDGFVLPFDAYHASDRGTRLPDSALDALTTGLARLGPGPLAVRSSAAGEDTAGASAAGQHESVLAVHGPDDVARAVRACWASLHSPRATAYRDGLAALPPTRTANAATPSLPDASGQGGGDRREGGPDRGAPSVDHPPGGADATGHAPEPAMAVLVQRLVDADASGVMFVSGGPGEATVIEASWGLGPSVVGGTVTPDTYRVVAHPTLGRHVTRITDRAVADKRTRLDREGDRLVTRDVATDQRRRPVLDDTTAVGLAQLGWRVADLLGGPQDVEWALADDRLLILQSRPVTAALPTRDDAESAEPGGGPTPGTTRLRGTPGSVGVATGPARIVRGPADFARVRPGDVLVCAFTDPAWTPLLRVASAVVTETGGVLSHAAIVARERRIPAVLGVAGATTEIPDVSLLRVDGAAGTVDIVAWSPLAARRAASEQQPPPVAG